MMGPDLNTSDILIYYDLTTNKPKGLRYDQCIFHSSAETGQSDLNVMSIFF